MLAQVSIRDHVFGFAKRSGMHSLAGQIFIGTIVLMVGALILMSFGFSSLKASRIQAEATEDTLLEITSIDARLLESDGALNGYVIGQDPWFARRIATDRSDFRAVMKKLGHSVSNNPQLYDMYKAVADSLAQRQAQFEYLVQHRDEVAHVDRSAAAQAERSLTVETRKRLWDLLFAERTKRFAQHTAMIHEAQQSFWIAVGIVILSIISGAISLLLASVPVETTAKRS